MLIIFGGGFVNHLADPELGFFIENTFAMLSGLAFQQTVSIPMRTNCSPSLPDLFFLKWKKLMNI
jgi:hypothetical protein